MDVRLLAALSGEGPEMSVAELCRRRGVSRKTFYKWRARFLAEGMAGLEPRRSTPRSSPRRIPDVVEQAIVEKRKWLLDFGLDAGPESIRDHLVNRGLPMVPSRNTIWRVLVRRGFVTPQPQKRPRVSCVRFEAAAPNECWQIDATEWRLSNRKVVEVINIIDDHSRLAVATKAVEVTTTHAAWEAFEQAAMTWGFPTRCLSDNGLAFTGRLRRMEVFFQVQLRKAGVRAVNSRPRHPQTCGKVERFQQTEKRWLRARPVPMHLEELQEQLNAFADYYNYSRLHRGIGRRIPFERWAAQAPMKPETPGLPAPTLRVRRKVHPSGVVMLNPNLIVGLGTEYAGQRTEVIRDGGHVAVFIDGSLVRHLAVDPGRIYQPTGRRPGRKRKDGS